MPRLSQGALKVPGRPGREGVRRHVVERVVPQHVTNGHAIHLLARWYGFHRFKEIVELLHVKETVFATANIGVFSLLGRLPACIAKSIACIRVTLIAEFGRHSAQFWLRSYSGIVATGVNPK